MNPSTKTTTLAGLAGLALASGSLQAATIYSETFSDGSVATPTDLNGSTPDVTIGVNTWSASEWQENGSTTTIATSTSTTNEDSAFLAFTPTAGNIYTLSATMSVPTGGATTGWVGLGFAETNTTTGSFFSNNAAPWILYRPDTNVDSFLGVGATNSADEGNWSVSATFSLVLNTEAAAWTAEWFIDGGSVRGPVAYGTNPTIGYVGFGRENGNKSSIDNFSLSDNSVITEPSTTALIGLGGLALILRRRK